MNIKKVLILGSKGMLGQELLVEFTSHGYDVVGWDKDELDITDFSIVNQKVVDLCPDILINAVAYNLVDKIEEDENIFELAQKINGEAVGNLAKICKEINSVFVHYSSDYVFKGDDNNGYKEDDVINPVNKYGFSKGIGESQLLEIGGKFYLIRLSKLFGKPAVSVGAKKSFVDTMIWLVTEGGKTSLEIVNEEVSCITYTPDLAKLTRSIIENERSKDKIIENER